MKEHLKKILSSSIASVTELSPEEIEKYLEKPKTFSHGDLAFPCFQLAKLWKLDPAACAKKLVDKLTLPENFDSVTPLGPFLNFRFSRAKLVQAVLAAILKPEGTSSTLAKTVILEYSSPNIAKPFHVGHLRATLIGNCLDRVYRHAGHKVISINHLGDWGTQFGFVYAGCKIWGRPANDSVEELVDLYRRATELKERQETTTVESTNYPNVNELARTYFLDLERGEPTAREFWQWCVDISMKYFVATYQRLNVRFDHYTGESFYSDKLDAVSEELQNSGILQTSQGAQGIDLGENLGFARVFTADGRSLYLTRDIAAAKYRAQTFQFDQCIYVVGAPQTLHFAQLKAILKALGHDYADRITHVPFGHVLGMKTRGGGEFIELNTLLNEAYDRALSAYQEQVSKRPEGLDEQEVARAVGLSALVFSTLSRSRQKDVQFSWDDSLAFHGDTGPYLLYACARINGIKEKALEAGLSQKVNGQQLIDDQAYQLTVLLSEYPDVISRTMTDYEPTHLASYALDVAKAVSQAYNTLKVVGAEKEAAEARLALFEASHQVLKQCVELLGMTPISRM